jgi:hypothetical protein
MERAAELQIVYGTPMDGPFKDQLVTLAVSGEPAVGTRLEVGHCKGDGTIEAHRYWIASIATGPAGASDRPSVLLGWLGAVPTENPVAP